MRLPLSDQRLYYCHFTVIDGYKLCEVAVRVNTENLGRYEASLEAVLLQGIPTIV